MGSEEKTPAEPKGEAESQLPRPLGDPSVLLDSVKFDQAWRLAKVYAAAELVPANYRNKPADCFIALNAAIREGFDPAMYMQHTYVVGGRPSQTAVMIIARINRSGIFTPLEWRFTGTEKSADWTCICSATRKATGRECITQLKWQTVLAEGWLDKAGSKWKTMPEQMMQYRSAAFFSRTHCPEITMGWHTTDEMEDVRRTVETSGRVIVTPDAPEPPDDEEEPDAPPAPEADYLAPTMPEAWSAAGNVHNVQEEIDQLKQQLQQPSEQPPPPEDSVIGTAEASKFWPAYRKKYGREEKPLRAWLASHGYSSSKLVRKADFEAMLRELT